MDRKSIIYRTAIVFLSVLLFAGLMFVRIESDISMKVYDIPETPVPESEPLGNDTQKDFTIMVPVSEHVISLNVHDRNYIIMPNALNRSRGVYYFGENKEQRETYYNLPMGGVVANAHRRGIEGEYWINEYGCKMLGDYIMIAVNYGVHPYGSLVETSLGTGIAVDTGGFAADNPLQVDIATDW